MMTEAQLHTSYILAQKYYQKKLTTKEVRSMAAKEGISENYKCPLLLILVAFIAISTGVSCSHSQRQSKILSNIETLVYANTDSALALMNDIDVFELKADSLKAFYYLLKASAHKAKESPMLSDSLIRFSFEYYKTLTMIDLLEAEIYMP